MTRNVEYLTPDGTGYAQQGFKWPCSRCKYIITKTSLAMDKLAQDLVKEHDEADAPLDTYLPCVRSEYPSMTLMRQPFYATEAHCAIR